MPQHTACRPDTACWWCQPTLQEGSSGVWGVHSSSRGSSGELAGPAQEEVNSRHFHKCSERKSRAVVAVAAPSLVLGAQVALEARGVEIQAALG